ncbi:hypothetical protein HDU93_004563, partial [Gonapodya sp. JEL0774]
KKRAHFILGGDHLDDNTNNHESTSAPYAMHTPPTPQNDPWSPSNVPTSVPTSNSRAVSNQPYAPYPPSRPVYKLLSCPTIHSLLSSHLAQQVRSGRGHTLAGRGGVAVVELIAVIREVVDGQGETNKRYGNDVTEILLRDSLPGAGTDQGHQQRLLFAFYCNMGAAFPPDLMVPGTT